MFPPDTVPGGFLEGSSASALFLYPMEEAGQGNYQFKKTQSKTCKGTCGDCNVRGLYEQNGNPDTLEKSTGKTETIHQEGFQL